MASQRYGRSTRNPVDREAEAQAGKIAVSPALGDLERALAVAGPS
jgi:hypothetical protein